jgi:fucose permease
VDDVFAITADSSQLNSVFAHPHIIKRVIAQFRLCRSTGGNRQLCHPFREAHLAGYAGENRASLSDRAPAGFMIGRFLGSWMMKRIPARGCFPFSASVRRFA